MFSHCVRLSAPRVCVSAYLLCNAEIVGEWIITPLDNMGREMHESSNYSMSFDAHGVARIGYDADRRVSYLTHRNDGNPTLSYFQLCNGLNVKPGFTCWNARIDGFPQLGLDEFRLCIVAKDHIGEMRGNIVPSVQGQQPSNFIGRKKLPPGLAVPATAVVAVPDQQPQQPQQLSSEQQMEQAIQASVQTAAAEHDKQQEMQMQQALQASVLSSAAQYTNTPPAQPAHQNSDVDAHAAINHINHINTNKQHQQPPQQPHPALTPPAYAITSQATTTPRVCGSFLFSPGPPRQDQPAATRSLAATQATIDAIQDQEKQKR